MGLLRGIRNILMASMIVVLIFTNILSITNAKFHDFLYGALSYIPSKALLQQSKSKQFQSLSAENKRLRKKNEKLRKTARLRKAKLASARKIFKRIVGRTVKNVSFNVSSILGEAIPYAGLAVIVTATAYDVYTGCENIKDTNGLLKILDGDLMVEEEAQVCGMTLPSEEQIRDSLKKYRGQFDDLIGGTIYEIIH